MRWYIQHLMDESEDENKNPLSEQNWMKQTNWKFIKYVMKPFEEIIKIGHEQLDTEEGESNEEESNMTQTLQIHNVSNTTMCDEDNTSEPEDETSDENSVNEIEPHLVNGEQNNVQEDKLLTTN